LGLYTIEFTDKSTNKGGAVTSKTSSKSTTDISNTQRELAKFVSSFTKSLESTISKALTDGLSRSLKGSGVRKTQASNTTNISKEVNTYTKNLFKDLDSKLSSLGKQPSGVDVQTIVKEIITGSDKKIDQLIKVIQIQTGGSIDVSTIKKLKESLNTNINKAASPEIVKALTNVQSAVNELSAASKSITGAALKLSSIRKSDSKISMDEFTSYFSNIKSFASNSKDSYEVLKSLKNSIDTLIKVASKNNKSTNLGPLGASFGKAAANSRQQIITKTKTIRDNIKEDPKKIATTIANAILKVLKDSPLTNNSKLVDTLTNFEGGVKDLNKLAGEIANGLKQAKSVDTKGLLTTLKSITTKQVPIDAIQRNKEWKEYATSINTLTKIANTIVTKIELVVDKLSIKRQVKKATVEASKEVDPIKIPLDIDTSSLDIIEKQTKTIQSNLEDIQNTRKSFNDPKPGTVSPFSKKEITNSKKDLDKTIADFMSNLTTRSKYAKGAQGTRAANTSYAKGELRQLIEIKDLDKLFSFVKERRSNIEKQGPDKFFYSGCDDGKQSLELLNKIFNILSTISPAYLNDAKNLANKDTSKNIDLKDIVKELKTIVASLKNNDSRGLENNTVDYLDRFTKAVEKSQDNYTELKKIIDYSKSSPEQANITFSGFDELISLVTKIQESQDIKADPVTVKVSSVIESPKIKPALQPTTAATSKDPAAGSSGIRRVNLAKEKLAQKSVYSYKDAIIPPSKSLSMPIIGRGKKLNQAEELRKLTHDNISELASSLVDLRQYIVDTLSKELKKYNSGWEIVRDSETQPISEYFNMQTGFNKKKAGKQYSLKIANMKELRSQTGNYNKDATPTSLISDFKNITHNKLISSNKGVITEEIAKWLKRNTDKNIDDWDWKNVGKSVVENLKSAKKNYGGKGFDPPQKFIDELNKLGRAQLESIYKDTLSEIHSNKLLNIGTTNKYKKKVSLTRNISVQAARRTSTGAATFETATGSQRVIPKFATYKSGFENLYEDLKETKALNMDKGYATTIQGFGVRPGASKFKEVSKTSKAMLLDLASVSKKTRADIIDDYKAATIIKGKEIKDQGRVESSEQFTGKIDNTLANVEQAFIDGKLAAEDFISTMDDLGLTTVDVVKNMESVDFENIYQVFKRMLSSDTGTKPLTTLAMSPDFDKSIRDYEMNMRKLIGTIPIADSSRPRRFSHQEKIVNLQTMASDVYDGSTGAAQFNSEEQKQYIRDLNLVLKDFISNSDTLKGTKYERNIPTSVSNLTSLGVPEEQASTLKEFRNSIKSEDSKYLAALNATNVKMYTDTLTDYAPFGQFQQAGRNISSTTNAMSYRPTDSSIGTDFPSLRTTKENETIAAGRYGSQGYGFNVIAELRNTANTFEDQIVIAGKLGKILTSVTKTIVQPSALGRSSLTDARGRLKDVPDKELGVSTIIDGKERQNLVDVRKSIDDLNRVFQNVLGVPQKYRGRADKALIKDIEQAVTVVRGEDLNIQTAKIAETFFNYYGRKFTTRYGSKGVSVQSTAGVVDKSLVNKLGNIKNIKVLDDTSRENTGLGSAIMPRSMGALMSDIFTKYSKELVAGGYDVTELKRSLQESGNKFMISIFSNSDLGVVPKYEAEAQRILYTKVFAALNSLDLGFSLGKDIEGIKKFKKDYSSEIEDGKLYEEKPIDIRISSYGAGKRGLQTELLESAMGNVVGTGQQGSTTLNTNFKPDVYKSILGTEGGGKFPSLSEYSKALGFTVVDKNTGEMEKEIFNMLAIQKDIISEKEASSLISKKDSKEGITIEQQSKLDERMAVQAQARSMAKLEASSNFYSNTIDEFGNERKSIIGPKFVEIVEDPNANPPWSKSDISKQIKGERLNIPAFGAYASIFGKDSNIISEMSKSIPLDAKKHWEYLKALQAITDETGVLKDNLLKSAQKVDVSTLTTFTESTGTFMPSEIDSGRSLINTILDTKKFPGAINLQIPDSKDPSKRQDFYVPGALARSTYPEPNIAGERGLDLISRRLTRVVDAAKEVDNLRASADITKDGSTRISDTRGRIVNRLTNLRKEVDTIVAAITKNPEKREDKLGRLEQILESFRPALTTFGTDPDINLTRGVQYGSANATSAQTYIDDFLSRQKGKNKPIEKAYQTTINEAVDQLIGPNPNNLKTAPERRNAENITSKASSFGVDRIDSLARSLNVNPAKDDDRLGKKLDALERAKINYYHTLANTVLGKTGSVQEFLFTRKVPAIMAKATNAVVDKTEDFKNFKSSLESIITDTELDTGILSTLESAIEEIDSIAAKHSKSVSAQRKKGFVVLKQHQLGVPEEQAKRLPAEFTKTFSFDSKGNVSSMLSKEDQTKGETLKDLLEYRESLQKGIANLGSDSELRSSVQKDLDQRLTPYIESVRYPFTGISSVQPYEAKLLSPEKGKRQLSKHSLAVPGIPDLNIEEFDMMKKSIDEVVDKLTMKREIEYGKVSPDTEEISRLTQTIHKLNEAISNVIPKYVAHQQKLDFDGDQIEIHSAKTAASRKEIEAHYKKLTTYDTTGSTTAKAYGDQFTYDAVKGAKITGKYTLAEQQLAFEKKFPKEEGFGYLKSPFLTKELEYLQPEKKLEILSNIPNELGVKGDPLSILKNVVEDSFKNDKIKQKLNTILDAVKGKDGDPLKYSTVLLKALEKNSPRYAKIINNSVSDELYNKKYLNTVNAQLFKTNVGPDTEALNRILKIVEHNIGFGPGMAETGKSDYNFTESLEKRYPKDLKIFGDEMGQELNFLINEVVRVGIQKGLDVKHAGEIPIAEEITNLLSQSKPGTAKLLQKIEEGGSYSDLKELRDANKKALMARLGDFSTEDLLIDASKVASGRGQQKLITDWQSEQAEGKNIRPAVKDYLVKELGFESFLGDISRQLEEATYNGIIKGFSTMAPSKRAEILKGQTPENYARYKIKKQLESGGLDIKNLAENQNTPLYKYRSSGADLYKQRGIYQETMGHDVTVPEIEGRFLGQDKQFKEYRKKLAESKAVAKNMQSSFGDFTQSGMLGDDSYSILLKESIEKLRKDAKDIILLNKKADRDADKIGLSLEEKLNVASLQELSNEGKRPLTPAEKLIDPKHAAKLEISKPIKSKLDSLSATLMQATNKDAYTHLETLGRKVGVLGVSSETMATRDIDYRPMAMRIAKQKMPDPSQQQGEKFEKLVSSIIDKAVILDQAKTILDAAKTKKSEGIFLEGLFPRYDKMASQGEFFDSTRAEVQVSNKEQMARIPRSRTTGVGFDGMAAESSGMLSPGQGPVPVYLVGVASDVMTAAESTGVQFSQAKSFAQTTTKEKIPLELFNRIEEAKEIVDKLTGKLNDADTNESNFGEKYRASQLKGTSEGLRNRNNQIEAIKEVMTKFSTKSTPGEDVRSDIMTSSSLVGTGMHVKLQEELYKNLSNVSIEVPVKFESEIAGEVSGTIDVLQRDDNGTVQKVIDIKTLSDPAFKHIEKAVERLQKKKGTTEVDWKDVKEELSGKGASYRLKNEKLDEVASQLNLYLASEQVGNKAAKAEAHFYSRAVGGEKKKAVVSFSFDPKRLERDMSAIKIARDTILAEQGEGAFAPTASFKQAEAIAAKLEKIKYDAEEVNKLIRTGRDYSDVTQYNMYRGSAASSHGRGGPKARMATEAKRAAAKKAFDLDQNLTAKPVTSGKLLSDVHTNLTNLHKRSKLLYATLERGSVGTEGPDFEMLHKEIKKAILEITDSGPKRMDFSKLVTDLSKKGELKRRDVTKAWQTYNIAQGDYFVELTERMKKNLEEDPYDVSKYSDYESTVKKFQKFVRGSLGKRTDIYTYNKQYVSPELARGAQVYLEPEQLMKKVSGPLGNDEDLLKTFKQMVDVPYEEYPSPKEAVRTALRQLVKIDDELLNIYTDAEKVARVGEVIEGAWDFSNIKVSLARMKAALKLLKENSFDEDPEKLEYYDKLFKRVSGLDTMYADMDFGNAQTKDATTGTYGDIGLIKVPKVFSATEQLALHERNVKKITEYYQRLQDLGGAKIGEALPYDTKVFSTSGQVIKNKRTVFNKYGESINSAGEKVSNFTQKEADLMEMMQGSNKTFKLAIGRVVRWGAAATLVYGGFGALKSAVNEISDVEMAIANLRMVMNPLQTDFNKLQNSAVGFAKKYGVETTGVLRGMKIFAQQGLGQEEVIDRTETATLASNVTTLNSVEATEALTASMKIFGTEGEKSMRFLDAWSEVESKAAITAGDLADAIKKAASAGKNAGFTFDELNGMIAAIGSVTRQTGKEVGTSLRFIFRRLSAEKGPRELAKQNIPTIGPEGQLRDGFDILSDLAGSWDELGNSQKLSVAQAIGGTRQYNQVLVLMDNWDEVLRSLTNSMNSKGSAERRNLELMKTYAKQLEQTKASASELKIELGKVILPTFKAGLKGMKLFLDTVNAIPTSIKAAGAGLATLFAFTSKGAPILKNLFAVLDRGSIMAKDFSADFKKGLEIGGFEALGIGDPKKNDALYGLTTIGGEAAKGMDKFHSSIGKTGYLLTEIAKSYNSFLGTALKKPADLSATVAGNVKDIVLVN